MDPWPKVCLGVLRLFGGLGSYALWVQNKIIPVRGFHDWLISAQARVGTGGGRISKILGVPAST